MSKKGEIKVHKGRMQKLMKGRSKKLAELRGENFVKDKRHN